MLFSLTHDVTDLSKDDLEVSQGYTVAKNLEVPLKLD